MSRGDRVAILAEIQKQRDSFVITYLTSTRPNLDVPMAMDSVRLVYDHLRAHRDATKKNRFKVDLFLHSNGGEGTVPWRLVNLVREYAETFVVLVPHNAYSAATLTALGADEIVMHPMGNLGPTDPTVANAFNPSDPANPAQRIGISVEDVTAYIALLHEDAGIRHEEEFVQAFNKLADSVHPLALGNVKRSLSQSRLMARKLLALHMDHRNDGHKIDEIVENLNSKLFFHGHPINRREARDQIGLSTVHDAETAIEPLMWNLYCQYEAEMLLLKPFLLAQEFLVEYPTLDRGASAITKEHTAKLAFVESVYHCDVSLLRYEISGQKNPDGGTNTILITNSHGWNRE